MNFLLQAQANLPIDPAKVGELAKPDFWDRVLKFVQVNGINLIVAILIFVIGKWIAKWITSLLRKMMSKKSMDTTIVSFLGNIIYAVLLIFVIIAAIGKLGFQTTSLVAIFGAAGLAVGLALQGSLSNFAAGVMLILFKPFKLGETVIAAGQTGTVSDIGIFHTTIVTSDNRKIIVPNTAITGGPITNFSALPTRRLELNVSVPGTTDLNRARDILLGLMNADSRILKSPAAGLAIADANAAEIKFGITAHVNNAELGAVQSDLLEKIKRAFTEAGIWV
jgi:small conductance mechanosensitive channel